MKKTHRIILLVVVLLVIGVGVLWSSKNTYINTFSLSTPRLAETSWEMVQYSTGAQTASIRGTDWFVFFGKDKTGYLKLCETYPFSYTQMSDTQIVFTFEEKDTALSNCQDTDGIQQFIREVFTDTVVFEKIAYSTSATQYALVFSKEQKKIAMVPRAHQHTPSSVFQDTFKKKEQFIQITPSFVCEKKSTCTDSFETALFPVVLSLTDEPNSATQDKKLMLRGGGVLETALGVGTYTIKPGIALTQPFTFEPLIFSVTSIQDAPYEIPLSITILK